MNHQASLVFVIVIILNHVKYLRKVKIRQKIKIIEKNKNSTTNFSMITLLGGGGTRFPATMITLVGTWNGTFGGCSF